MRIALDAMGTDLAPEPEVLGALQALENLEPDIEIVLVGDEPVVRAVLETHGGPRDRLSIHHAPDRVTASDPPASVIRKKPDSSIVVGLKLHKEAAADAFVSAGSTGAMMATSLFTLRRSRVSTGRRSARSPDRRRPLPADRLGRERRLQAAPPRPVRAPRHHRTRRT
jgi:phosphate acyltransferase